MANKSINVTEKEMAKILEGSNVEPKTKTIRIVGNAIVLTSKLKFATIQKMEKYNSNALCLIEKNGEEENEIFRVMTGKLSSIAKHGIVFAEANKDGYAVATTLFPVGVTDKKEYIKDNFATVLFMLKDLEAVIETSCAELEAAFAKLDEEIEEE